MQNGPGAIYLHQNYNDDLVMAKEKKTEDLLNEKLDKLIKAKKEESSALKKIFNSIEESKKDKSKT